jgi:hypothetical protein
MPRKVSIGKSEKIYQPRHSERRPSSDPDRSGTRGHDLLTGLGIGRDGTIKGPGKKKAPTIPLLSWLEPKRTGNTPWLSAPQSNP